MEQNQRYLSLSKEREREREISTLDSSEFALIPNSPEGQALKSGKLKQEGSNPLQKLSLDAKFQSGLVFDRRTKRVQNKKGISFKQG